MRNAFELKSSIDNCCCQTQKVISHVTASRQTGSGGAAA
jgi:hypothetical protein